MERPEIELRAWRDEDEPAYEAIVCDPAVVEYLGDPDSDPVPQGPLVDVIGDIVCVRAAAWHDGELVGAIWVSGCGDEPAEVTVAIRPDRHGAGLGRATVAAAAALIRDRFPTVVLGGRIRTDNTASLSMATALGATLIADEDPDYLVVAPAA
jgi:RimJ/RimL family protein N-acetyltransferase